MKLFPHLLFFLIFFNNINAQNISVGSIDNNMMEERARNNQLLDKGNPLISFALRPLAVESIDTSEVKYNLIDTEKIKFSLLPITLKQQYNTFAPYGWNDGIMIPAKGYQSFMSAGLYAKYGMFSVQLRPEYVFAANPNFEIFPTEEDEVITSAVRIAHLYYLNTTDLPVPFGDKSYSRFGWGQSSIRFNFNSLSAGISTENLWWGPGQRNSLIMSNNAPGFLHATFNTRKPVKTFLGSFEFQLISGKLENSGIKSPKSQFIIDGVDYEVVKRDEWRYINAVSISYQPKWVPGLFLGLNRSVQIYNGDLGGSFLDYFPVILPIQKKSVGGNEGEDKKNRDQIASVFLRWVMKESKFELYGEYGKNDYPLDYYDMFQNPEHSRAYIMGFSKIFMINENKSKYLKCNVEITTMEQTADRIIRPAGAWYEHSIILQGFTNRGEVLGAGIGPGSNLQTLDFSFWEKSNSLGIQFERYAHNLDFYYDAFTPYQFSYKWVDLAINAYAYRRYGNLGIQAKINTSKLYNYQYIHANDKYNMQFQINLQYYF
ncbi:capsule assembly Wzi family protein [Flavobacterium sp. HJJ]|uniref:capsule assembly Wzi family protein n=1 Tax=Flavobacterium sp. HJJ TaxID=2783792 RepID=UPI00188A1C14|nr:capsule assembly Wzi family protein [Flavobacterium sp. HJJ]MBF4472475.1 hypothetical protein [Flavobacterium sp. HJJ]